MQGGQLAGGQISDSTWAGLIDHARSATVRVATVGCSFTATGSGFTITPTEVVTNRHVAERAVSISVRGETGTTRVTSWEISTTDDLAVLDLDHPVNTAVLALDTSTPIPGDLVAVVGFPLGGPMKVARGRVLAVRGASGPSAQRIETSADILPGSSGGPVIGTDGRVRAVTVALDLRSDTALDIPAARVAVLRSTSVLRRPSGCPTVQP
ncbi:serine protease [Nocardioides terrisoli]|uniref:serine protease n=1 Tax=Nocardioides terrisoli TaxID=3388267 RepID=UPI00287B83AB|nr:serine protease [Nocardioides marmorisolisilvae]